MTSLEPSYRDGVEDELDRIMDDPRLDKLYVRIVETLNFILEHSDTDEARRYAIAHPQGTIWRTPILRTGEDQNWSILWATDGKVARFLYVGLWPPVQQ